MSTQPDDDWEDALLGLHTVEFDRYATVRLGDGGLMIYDTENEDGWLQSEGPVDLAESV